MVPYPPEYADIGPQPGFDRGGRLLGQVATATGGRTLAQPQEAFAPDLPPAYGRVPLAWWLLMAATLLLPLDVAVRRLNLRRADLAEWTAAARAWVGARRARVEPQEASPILARMRRRRAGHARAVAHIEHAPPPQPAAGIEDRRSARPAAQEKADAPLPPPQRPRPRPEPSTRQQPREGPPVPQSESASPTERWLEAKRRARRRP